MGLWYERAVGTNEYRWKTWDAEHSPAPHAASLRPCLRRLNSLNEARHDDHAFLFSHRIAWNRAGPGWLRETRGDEAQRSASAAPLSPRCQRRPWADWRTYCHRRQRQSEDLQPPVCFGRRVRQHRPAALWLSGQSGLGVAETRPGPG